MASTYKCNKCGIMFRTSNPFEFVDEKIEHKKICDGKWESIWKNMDKMTNEEKVMLGKAVMFRHGKITT